MPQSNQHLPCPKCDSSDAFTLYDTGWGHCFSCSANVPPERNSPIEPVKPRLTSSSPEAINTFIKKHTELSPIVDNFRAFRKRGLSKDTIRRYRVNVADGEGANYVSKSPLFEGDKHVANKVRYEDKSFSIEGDFKKVNTLFGQTAFPAGSAKAITITEGYEDAMAAYEMLGSKYPCVSIHSASTARKDAENAFEYLNSFDKIYLVLDNDEAGSKAADAICSLPFPLEKLHVLKLRSHKDANDYHINHKAEQFSREWWQAPAYKPNGLKLGSEMWSEIIDRKTHFTVPYPFEGMNDKTYGLRLSEMVILTADTGIGKTSLLKEIEHSLLVNPDVVEKGYGVGFLHFEEPNGDTALGLLSIHNSQPYHLPDVERPEDALRAAYDTVLNNSRAVIWDHFGSNSVDEVLSKTRHMYALGCRYIVIDHLSIIVSDQSGDERKQLDEIATKLKTLTMELNICVIAVIHTNRQGQIRGTAGVEQLANIVIKAERNKTDTSEWRRNVTRLTIEKNRFCGRTGPASYLYYNEHTGRLSELTKEEIEVYENGSSPGADAPW